MKKLNKTTEERKENLQKSLGRIFNNFLGRWYLKVPKGKKLHKVTPSSVHYYTGGLGKNGQPLICTGGCSPGGRFVFNRVMSLAKVVSVFAFIPLFPNSLLPLIALTDTGFHSPTVLGINGFHDPTNAYTEDGNFAYYGSASTGTIAGYKTWSLGITAGSTINGIEVGCKGELNTEGLDTKVWVEDAAAGMNYEDQTWDTTNDWYYSGGSTSLWGKSWTAAYLNGTDFQAGIANNTGGVVYYLDNIKVKVYYTIPVVVPTVTTQAVSDIDENTATGNGNITDDGGDSDATRGICWDTSATPTTSDSHAANGTGEGAYTVAMTGLIAGTKYYVRAYSINSEGTSYGSEVDFTTDKTIGPFPTHFRI